MTLELTVDKTSHELAQDQNESGYNCENEPGDLLSKDINVVVPQQAAPIVKRIKRKTKYEKKLDFGTTNKQRQIPLERISKTNKLLWTAELHQIFLHAIRKLGINGNKLFHTFPLII